MRAKNRFVVLVCVFVAWALFSDMAAAAARSPLLANPDEARIEALLQQMTLEEKVSMLGGTGFATRPIPRLGIPELPMTDGPVGVRWEKATAFPSGISMGASFDPVLVGEVANGIARDAIALGRYMVLGPCVNLTRTPFGGRNFESFGEDPFLSSRLAADYVYGVQREGAVASVKHFALNEQETDRMIVNVVADERTMRELHFPAFHSAVRAGVWTVMASYNRVNGPYASASSFLMQDVLKGEWGFRGLVVSDWGAVHDTVGPANAGLDLEMPFGEFFGAPLLEAVRDGSVPLAAIDDKVRRILRVIDAVGLIEGTQPQPTGITNDSQNQALALKLAQESIVLLKNSVGMLPLDPLRHQKIAVIGPTAAFQRSSGGGSSMVNPFYHVTALQGLEARAAGAYDLRYAPGVRIDTVTPIEPTWLRPSADSETNGVTAEYFANRDLAGEPTLVRVEPNLFFNWAGDGPAAGLPLDNFSARFRTKLTVPTTGKYLLSLRSDDGMRIFLDGNGVFSEWYPHSASTRFVEIELEAGRAHDFVVEYFEDAGHAALEIGLAPARASELEEAVRLAASSDAALLFVGLSSDHESEGFDRQTLELPENQRVLIDAVLSANPNTVIVLSSGAVVLLHDYAERAKALVAAWYPGQEGGTAIADVLFGNVNPSGKLPITWVKRWEDHSAFGRYPGTNARVEYSEGIFLGYRWADQQNLAPEYPFGFGLSYTSFALENLRIEAESITAANPRVTVFVDVVNTGDRRGAEVAQLYVADAEASVERPVRELKGFEKVWLAPGERKTVRFELDSQAFAFWSPMMRAWTVEPGMFRFHVGTSSRDLPLTAELSLQ